MVIKLYKKEADQTLYWEGFSHDGGAVFREGIVGGSSDPEMVRPDNPLTVKKVIANRAAEMKSKGFVEMPIAEHATLIIQHRIDGFGTEQDLTRRHRVEEVIHDELGDIGGGAVDGGDIGSGSSNVFCFIIDPDAVLQPVIARLKRAGLIGGAVIAVSPAGSDKEPTVVWPTDFQGTFSTLYLE